MSRIGQRQTLVTSGTVHPPTNRERTGVYGAHGLANTAKNTVQSRRVLRTTTAIAPQGAATTLYLYDGWNIIAEYQSSSLNTENLQLKTSLTWKTDLSGTLQGAGGAYGLLAVSDHRSPSTDHFFPTYDANRKSSYSLPLVPTVPAVHDYDTHLHTPKSLNLQRILPPAPTTQTATLYSYDDRTNPTAPNSYPCHPFVKSQGKEYGFRYYEPLTGKWLNRGPIEEEGGLNFSYTDNHFGDTDLHPKKGGFCDALADSLVELYLIISNRIAKICNDKAENDNKQ